MALVTGQEQSTRKGPPLIVQAGALLAVTALAAGIGWYAGDYLQARQAVLSGSAAKAADNAHPGKPAESAATATSNAIALDPITTNLADPEQTWVRMELALVFDGEPAPDLAQQIHQDLFAYMRTVKLRQIDSASGFQHLKADLHERARIRGGDSVSEVLITALLYE